MISNGELATGSKNKTVLHNVNTNEQVFVLKHLRAQDIDKTLEKTESSIGNNFIKTNDEGGLQLMPCPPMTITEEEHMDILYLLEEHNEHIQSSLTYKEMQLCASQEKSSSKLLDVVQSTQDLIQPKPKKQINIISDLKFSSALESELIRDPTETVIKQAPKTAAQLQTSEQQSDSGSFSSPRTNLEHTLPASELANLTNFHSANHAEETISHSKLECVLCKEMFSSTADLKKHFQTHKIEKRFRCSNCSASFSYENNLKVHIVNSHGNSQEYNSNTCSICYKHFRRKASFLAHVRTHQIEEVLTCEVCGGEYQSEKALMKHLELHALTTLISNRKLDLVCSYCGRTFEDKSKLVEHTTTHRFIKKYALKRKRLKKKKKEGIKRFICRMCGKSFAKNALLIRHIRVHTGEKPFLCSICGKGFSQKGTLKMHKAHHFEGKPYACNLCKARFLQKSNLKTHILKTHSTPLDYDQPIFNCSQCSCIFKKVSTLNGHITKVHRAPVSKENEPNIVEQVIKNLKILGSSDKNNLEKALEDTGKMELFEELGDGVIKKHWVITQIVDEIRYYICSVAECSHMFKKPSDLLRHNKKHSLEKPFKCSVCGKSFSMRSTLKNHVKTHNAILTLEGKKAFRMPKNSELKSKNDLQCSECRKKFGTAVELNRHYLAVHKVPKPYSCQYCKLDFTTYATCRKHLKNVHGVKSMLPEGVETKLNVQGNDYEPDISLPSVSTQMTDKNVNNFQMVYLDLQNSSGTKTESIMINSMKSTANDSTFILDLNKSKDLVDLDVMKLPVQILDNPVSSLSNTINEVPSDIFQNAQVICINCHQIYSDMNLFQKHDCPNNKNSNSNDCLLNYPIITSNDDASIVEKTNEDKSGEFDSNSVIQTDENSSDCTDGDRILEDANSSQVIKHIKLENKDVVEENLCEDNSELWQVKKSEIDNNCIEIDASQFLQDGEKQGLKNQDEDRAQRKSLNIKNNSDSEEYKTIIQISKQTIQNKTVKTIVPKLLKCHICGSTFQYSNSLRKHLSRMHRIRSLNVNDDKFCTVCGKTFQKPSDLVRHHRTHTGERPYTCDLCDKKFALKSTAERHRLTHENLQKTVRCNICAATYVTTSALKVHMNKHTGANPYPCRYCNEFFQSSSKRIFHEKKVHLQPSRLRSESAAKSSAKLLKVLAEEATQPVIDNENEEDKIMSEKDVQPIPYVMENDEVEDIDLSKVQTIMSMDELMRQLQNGTIILAPDSDAFMLNEKATGNNQNGDSATTSNIGQLVVFTDNQVISQDTSQPNLEGKVTCPICHKGYASQNSLRKHKKKIHGPNKKYPCIKCDKTYATQEEMNLHTKLHAGMRPYECKFCDNSFASESNLKCHITRMHEDAVLNQEATKALLNLQFDMQEADVGTD